MTIYIYIYNHSRFLCISHIMNQNNRTFLGWFPCKNLSRFPFLDKIKLLLNQKLWKFHSRIASALSSWYDKKIYHYIIYGLLRNHDTRDLQKQLKKERPEHIELKIPDKWTINIDIDWDQEKLTKTWIDWNTEEVQL